MRMMANDKEIALELAKNKTDEIIVKQELNSAKDKFINDLIIEALENGNQEKALEYLRKNSERIEKALEE